MTMLDISWMLTATALVVLMQAGFGALEAGLTRSKNSINVALKNMADFVVSCLLFWMVGYGIAFGSSWHGVVGTSEFFVGSTPSLAPTFLFYMALCGTASTIMSGAIAERTKFSSFLWASVLISSVVFPLAAHAAWNPEGVLAALGFFDFAGGSVVHMVGGATALAGVLVVGPRTGRFPEHGPPTDMTPSSLPMTVLGCFILIFGWMGFNGGSTLALTEHVPAILANTLLAGCMGGVASTALEWWKTGVPSAEAMVSGMLAGLVAGTAGANVLEHGSAVVVGFAGSTASWLCRGLLVRWRIDDVVNAVPIHLAAGFVGTVGVGLLGERAGIGTGQSWLSQVAIQACGALVLGAFAFAVSYAGFRALDAVFGVRVSPQDELRGLNFAEHGASTEIYELLQAMDQTERSGDLSTRARFDPYTDLGQVAKKYNDVLDTVEAQARDIAARVRENRTILASIGEGLVAVDADVKIRDGWSDAAAQMLGTTDLLGADLGQLLFDDTREGSRQRAKFEGFVATACALFLPEQFDQVVANAQTRIHRREPGSNEERCYALSYSPIVEDDVVTGVIVLFTDESELEALRAGASEGFRLLASAMSQLAELLEDEVKVESSALFLSEAVPVAETLATLVEDVEVLDIPGVLRELHTIKGGANLLDLAHVAHFAHEAESILSDLRAGHIEPHEAADGRLRRYTRDLSEGLRSLARVWQVARGSDPVDLEKRWNALALATERTIVAVAETLDKQVEVRITSDESLSLTSEDLKLLNTALIHLGRNSVDHGIESPAERTSRGKAARGSIRIHVGGDSESLEVRFDDDGRGVDGAKLAQVAFERGVTPTLIESPSESMLLRMMTASGLSSAAEVSKISGRGVGLDVIAVEVEKRSGSLQLLNRPGLGTTFILRWPREGGTSKSAA